CPAQPPPPPDFLRALLGRERSQADEAEARDEDRKRREIQEQLSLPLLLLVERLKVLVEKAPRDGLIGQEAVPRRVDVRERILQIVAGHADGRLPDRRESALLRRRWNDVAQWLQRAVNGFKIESGH